MAVVGGEESGGAVKGLPPVPSGGSVVMRESHSV